VEDNNTITDRPLAISLFAIGAIMYYLSYFFRESSYKMFGSSTEIAPRICAGLIMFFSVILFIQSAKRDKKNKRETSRIIEEISRDKDVYIMFAITALYIFFFQRLGFLTSTFLYTIGAISITSRGKIKFYISLIIAFAIALTAYLFFTELLNVILPRGILI